MTSTFSLYKGESSEKRPGLELFWWRSLTFFILYLIATIVFFNLRNYHISILQWFVTEQIEEEAQPAEIIATLKMIGEKGTALYMLDKELGKRSAG